MSGVGFEPNGMLMLVQVPNGAIEKVTPSGIEVGEATISAKRKEYIESGDKMIVAAIGADVKYKVGDLVAINIRGAAELKLDDIDEPFIIIREGEVLGKYDK